MNRHTAPFPPAGNRPPVFLPRQQVPPARHAAPPTVVPTPFPLPGYQPDHTVVNTLTSQSLAWLEENDLRFDFGQGFDFVPLPSPPGSPPPADDNPPGPHPSNDTLPPVLRALHHINEKQKSQAHRQLKQCTTIEQALVEMLAASNSGTHCHGPAPMRVGSVLGLVARLPLNSRVRETFACMCLVRMRMERSAMGVANRYIDLANTLPRQFPADELGPYQQVLIACGRLAIQQIRDEDAEHFKKQPSEALDALGRQDVRIEPLRGNLDTRLRKLDEGQYAGIVLAAAGLKRLEMSERIRHIFETDQMLPAAGQGALGIEIRSDRADLRALLAQLADAPSWRRVAAERAVSRAMGGSCSMPLAAHATIEGGVLKLQAAWGDPEGATTLVTADAQASADGLQAAEAPARDSRGTRGRRSWRRPRRSRRSGWRTC